MLSTSGSKESRNLFLECPKRRNEESELWEYRILLQRWGSTVDQLSVLQTCVMANSFDPLDFCVFDCKIYLAWFFCNHGIARCWSSAVQSNFMWKVAMTYFQRGRNRIGHVMYQMSQTGTYVPFYLCPFVLITINWCIYTDKLSAITM